MRNIALLLLILPVMSFAQTREYNPDYDTFGGNRLSRDLPMMIPQAILDSKFKDKFIELSTRSYSPKYDIPLRNQIINEENQRYQQMQQAQQFYEHQQITPQKSSEQTEREKWAEEAKELRKRAEEKIKEANRSSFGESMGLLGEARGLNIRATELEAASRGQTIVYRDRPQQPQKNSFNCFTQDFGGGHKNVTCN